MSKAVKIEMYKKKVKRVVVYGIETWAVTEMGVQKLTTWERKILRIHGPVVEQGIWGKRTIQELSEQCKDLDIVAGVMGLLYLYLYLYALILITLYQQPITYACHI